MNAQYWEYIFPHSGIIQKSERVSILKCVLRVLLRFRKYFLSEDTQEHRTKVKLLSTKEQTIEDEALKIVQECLITTNTHDVDEGSAGRIMPLSPTSQ